MENEIIENNIAVIIHVVASGRVVENVDMSIWRCFKLVSGLPDPRGRLSQSIPPAAIAEANRLAQEAAQQSSAKSTSDRLKHPNSFYRRGIPEHKVPSRTSQWPLA